MSSFKVYVVLGLIVLAGLAFAGVLLNIPIWAVALGVVLVLAGGFFFLTRRSALRTREAAGPGRK